MPTQRLHFEHFEIQTNDDGSLVKLGRGGMGTTYKAFDTRRRKHVALKVIDDKLLADRTSRRRFFNEARAASNLDHPNVVRVDYVCSDDAPECFYAMEWVDGVSLGERVKKSGALPPREALLLLRAVADALTVLGEQRLVHRDIKPDNIMIARAGRAGSRVKLIDFGLAKALENAADRFTSVDTGERFVGSVYFASPEQIRPRGELDSRSDFYSLGATLWRVLTGFPPFAVTAFDVQEGHVYHEPPREKSHSFHRRFTGCDSMWCRAGWLEAVPPGRRSNVESRSVRHCRKVRCTHSGMNTHRCSFPKGPPPVPLAAGAASHGAGAVTARR